LWAVIAFSDLVLAFFGMIRLVQLVGELEEARGQAERLAIAAERLKAAEKLGSAMGKQLAGVATLARAAREALSKDPAAAQAKVSAAGAAAREAGLCSSPRGCTAGDRRRTEAVTGHRAGRG
jgi:hypothetical protein